MARRRESRRRGKLDPRTLWALVGDEEVYEDADMVERYWDWREEVHGYSRRPGTRPAGWWALEAPEGAPRFEDYRGSYSGASNRVEPDPEGDLWTEDFDLDRLRFLARHGQLSDDEIAAKLAAPKDDRLPPYARETAERDAEAVLDGLADRQGAG
jgi:hypothetical protein